MRNRKLTGREICGWKEDYSFYLFYYLIHLTSFSCTRSIHSALRKQNNFYIQWTPAYPAKFSWAKPPKKGTKLSYKWKKWLSDRCDSQFFWAEPPKKGAKLRIWGPLDYPDFPLSVLAIRHIRPHKREFTVYTNRVIGAALWPDVVVKRSWMFNSK